MKYVIAVLCAAYYFSIRLLAVDTALRTKASLKQTNSLKPIRTHQTDKVQVSCFRERNMSLAKVLIPFLFYIDITISEDIEVDRLIPNDNKSKWKDGVDKFTLPSSVCRQWNQYCSSTCKTVKGGTSDNRYSCSCPGDSATLTYHNNEWRCRENAEVRKQLGKCLRRNSLNGIITLTVAKNMHDKVLVQRS